MKFLFSQIKNLLKLSCLHGLNFYKNHKFNGFYEYYMQMIFYSIK